MLTDSVTDDARTNAVLKISQAGLDFIKGFESFVGYVYDDLVPPVRGKYKEWDGGPVKGTLTVGYGHTDAAKHPLKIKKGLRVTEEEACEVLAVDLEDCENAVKKAIKVPLTQGQFDACVSFTFNCGAGSFANIAKRLNRGDYDAARMALDLYVKSKGVTLRGLQRRRDGEQALWDSVPPPRIAKDDTFHPAEVDEPKAPLPIPVAEPKAPDELVTQSRKLVVTYAYERLMKWLGFGAAGVTFADFTDPSGPVHQITSVIKDNALLLVLFGCLLGFGIGKIIRAFTYEDYRDGRYVPSREA